MLSRLHNRILDSRTEMSSSTDDDGGTALAPLPDIQAQTSIPRRRGYSFGAGASTVDPPCHERFYADQRTFAQRLFRGRLFCVLAQSDYSVLAQNMRGTAASTPRSLPAPRLLSPRRPPLRRSFPALICPVLTSSWPLPCLTSLTNQSFDQSRPAQARLGPLGPLLSRPAP